MKRLLVSILSLLLLPSLLLTAQRAVGPVGNTRTLVIQAGNVIPTELLIDNLRQRIVAYPTSFNLSVGRHVITARATGYEDISVTVDLTANQAITFNFAAIAVPVQKTVNLTINANVAGATVFINNSQVGTAGGGFSMVPGTYQVRVAAAGYQDFVTTLQLNSNQTLNVTLNPQNLTLGINSNVKNAQVFINNALAGTGNTNFSLPAGTYQVKVSADGFQDFVTTVQLSANQVLNVTLSQAMYTLGIVVNVKNAVVLINGKQAQATGAGYALSPGTYQVQVSAPGFQDFITTLQLNGNQTLNVTLTAAMGTIVIDTPRGVNVQVVIDGQRQKNQNDSSFSLPGGQHTIRVEHGQLSAETTVTLNPGQTLTLTPVFSIIVK